MDAPQDHAGVNGDNANVNESNDSRGGEILVRWNKQGLVFNTDGRFPWAVTHACVPTALVLEDRIRLYIAPRNAKGQSMTSFIDLDRADPGKVLYVHDRPILELGDLGCFDDCGIMPGSVVRDGDTVWLYYVGWNVGGTIPYRNAIGLAISEDGGRTFERMFPGPVVDRTHLEPHFAVSPCVLREGADWRLWYASGTRWVVVDGKPEPLYHIKYGHSDDGIHWRREDVSCILPLKDDEANARPTVVKRGGLYHMWYSYRGSRDFRDGADAYRIGYATSSDGVDWTRRDAQCGIDFSEDGFDDSMLAYPSVVEVDGRLLMFYNGNGFGRTGVGYAIGEEVD